ncbi:General transcription factor II-I repeat domain-containing protein 2 [Cucumispora dikerogammari]|nr:General transcription factor II-I repeat domain-containing protein 2 [Cucumispora dikerogammari]
MQSFFPNCFALQDAASEVSLVLSHMIVKRNKLFSDGEFIKDCLSRATDIICPEQKQKFESIPLSRKTVVKRINQSSENLMNQLRDVSKEFLCYSLALDESTDLQDTAQLLIFIRRIKNRFEITEELLGVESLKGTTTGRDSFGAVENCVEKSGLQWKNMFSVTTVGAAALVEKK